MHDKKEKNNNLRSHNLRRSRGFYFEDYEMQKYEYKEQSKSSGVKLSLNRVSFIFFIFIVHEKLFNWYTWNTKKCFYNLYPYPILNFF